MADSVEVLKQKYQRALLAIQSAEERYQKIREEKEEADRKSKQVDKQTRSLCQAILKKLQEAPGKKDSGKKPEHEEGKAWFTLDTIDLIAKADDALTQYSTIATKFMQSALALAKKERLKTAAAEEQIAEAKKTAERKDEQLAEKDKVIAMLQEELERAKKSGAEIKKDPAREKKLKAAMEKSKGVLPKYDVDKSGAMPALASVESPDALDLISDTVNTVAKGEVKKVVPEPVIVTTNKPIIDAADEKAGEVMEDIERRLKEICDNPEIMTPQNKAMIQVIGEYGVSARQAIYQKMIDSFDEIKSEKAGTMASEQLGIKIPEKYGVQLIEAVNIKTAAATRYGLILLTDLGKMAYTYMFGQEPKTSEAERLKKHHTTLEHGYGIKNFADLFQQMNGLKIDGVPPEVIYITRRKEFTIEFEIDNEKRAYIADIIVIQKKGDKGRRFYFEYETTKDPATDIIDKCNKMANVTNTLNFLVAGNNEVSKMRANLEAWLADVEAQKQRGHVVFDLSKKKTVRIFTYRALKDHSEASYEKWGDICAWQKNISPWKKPEEK